MNLRKEFSKLAVEWEIQYFPYYCIIMIQIYLFTAVIFHRQLLKFYNKAKNTIQKGNKYSAIELYKYCEHSNKFFL